ncbi:MAG TPA: radical SAM protein [Anaeromyxobacteraceae bacterium]|nr:radical SAM protein [Anaeromyxobacteraceae bacterium]
MGEPGPIRGRDLWKKLRFAWRFAREELVHLNLQLLYDCNFRCGICDFWKEPWLDRPRLSLEQVRVIAPKLRRLGPQIISIGGGEPLMHPELLPIAETLAPDHFLVMITNGWHLTREKAAALWRAGFYEVSVSVDYADPAKHDAQRATPGAHARALDALRWLHETRVHPWQRAHMISVVMDDNVDEIEKLVERSAEMGMGYLVTLYSHARGTKARRAGDRALGERLLAVKARHRHFLTMRGYLSRFGEAVSDGVGPCRAGKNLWNVDSQGNATLCIDKLDEPVGNLLTDDVEVIAARLRAAQASNRCTGCWTSCRGPIETMMYGGGGPGAWWDYWQLTRDVPLGGRF